MTKKGILKSDIKDLKASGKSLSFDVPGICVRTKAGSFIHGKVERIFFAKQIRVDKKYTRNHQSYLQVQVSGNIHGVRRYEHFITELRTVIGEIMDFEQTLVVLPYPNGPDSHKARPFLHDPSTLASAWKAKMYIAEDLYIADGKPTTVKMFMGHDSSAAVFNSLDLARKLDEREASIRVCHI